ncbi:hypothetical protein [Limnohabitans sp. Rim8]|uniref:hypothetical protein n=1 Tax=Limnohabitans sp. Rim8 TaxID=1100718 RepID=UPI00330622C0
MAFLQWGIFTLVCDKFVKEILLFENSDISLYCHQYAAMASRSIDIIELIHTKFQTINPSKTEGAHDERTCDTHPIDIACHAAWERVAHRRPGNSFSSGFKKCKGWYQGFMGATSR